MLKTFKIKHIMIFAGVLLIIGLVLGLEYISVPAFWVIVGCCIVLHKRKRANQTHLIPPNMQPHQETVNNGVAPTAPANTPAQNVPAYSSPKSDKHIAHFNHVTERGLYIIPNESEYNRGINRIYSKLEKLGEMISDACNLAHHGNLRNLPKNKEKIEEYLQDIIVFCIIEGQFMVDELNTHIDEINDYIDDFNNYMDNDYEKELAKYNSKQEEIKAEKKMLADMKKKIEKSVIGADDGMTRKDLCALFHPDKKHTVHKFIEELVFDGKIIEGKKGNSLHYTVPK